jgi:hypothetical protein
MTISIHPVEHISILEVKKKVIFLRHSQNEYLISLWYLNELLLIREKKRISKKRYGKAI